MTEPAPPVEASAARTPWFRVLCRIAGVATVVLGGWCLWLGYPAGPQPLDSEAFQDWNAEQASPVTAPPLQTSPAHPKRLAARFTDVSDSADQPVMRDSLVVNANRIDDSQAADNEFAVAGYTPEGDPAEPSELSEEPRSPAGAWLTGTIEENEAPTESDSLSGLSEIPAWKRSSKSQTRRTKTSR